MGEVTVEVRPDQTRLRIGVVSTAGAAERASAKNAERTSEVIARVREVLGQDADIRTSNYSLTKTFTDGYAANNTLAVRVHDAALMGKVIDAATKSGANVIGGIESSSLDEQDARSQALGQAETSTAPVPIPMLAGPGRAYKKSGKAAAITPVEASAIEIRAQVVVTLEVAP
jgi:uncharacterized protein YggE